MNKHTKTLLTIIICFILHYISVKQFKGIMLFIDEWLNIRLLSYFITYLIVGIPIFIGTWLVGKPQSIPSLLGLNGNILTALLLAVFFTLPMFLGSLTIGTIAHNADGNTVSRIIAGTVYAGLFEELYFRGFLFGLLFRYTRLGFIPAIILSSIIFAIGHLYQSSQSSVQAGIFLVTFLGSGYFAWLYTEWKYNLWVPILLHTFMNASWMIFDVSDNAMGGFYVNIFRVLTIATSIITTLVYKKRNDLKLEVNKTTLLLRPLNAP